MPRKTPEAAAREADAALRLQHAQGQVLRRRWERLDRTLKMWYSATHLDNRQTQEVRQKILLDLGLFGVDEKVRLLAAEKLTVASDGRNMTDDGVLDKIREGLGRDT